jgi:hypothetical protein
MLNDIAAEMACCKRYLTGGSIIFTDNVFQLTFIVYVEDGNFIRIFTGFESVGYGYFKGLIEAGYPGFTNKGIEVIDCFIAYRSLNLFGKLSLS